MTEDNLDNQRIKWWQEARFGMFIHWGLYAVPAGVWQGDEIPGIGEWIMNRARIPLEEYRKLAEEFNPVKFDAKEVVNLAKEAGMKYLVITAKHHDGFAMYDSKVSDYDIVDATPYGKDPMKALAQECKKAGIKLCFYYSQAQDWADPDAAGNDWDFPDEDKKDFGHYLENKVKPQLKELLTQYGPIGLIWFDTPVKITKEQSFDLKEFVHKIQPDCLVSGRVGHDVGDYGSMGDNEIPVGKLEGNWETPATMNDTWGFKKYDDNWKSTEELLYLLVDLASKGVNYLLNIGPTAEGEIPEPSIKRLKEIGSWLQDNGEAIYGTKASPFSYEFNWGRITQKPGKLYLLLTEWPAADFTLDGIRNKIKDVKMLKSGVKVKFEQSHQGNLDQHILKLYLNQDLPDESISVIELEIEGEADVDDSPKQGPDNIIVLPSHLSQLHGEEINISRGGYTKWHNVSEWLEWEFKVFTPGKFKVKVHTTSRANREWIGGHEISLQLGDKRLTGITEAGEEIKNPRNLHATEMAHDLGELVIEEKGLHKLRLNAEKINDKSLLGLAVTQVILVPVK